MGIRSMPFEAWIEVSPIQNQRAGLLLIFQLDKQFFDYHKIKAHRIRTRGQDALTVLGDRSGAVTIKSGRAGGEKICENVYTDSKGSH